MSKIQVEVRFTDKLESIRVGGQDMEIPNAIKTKSVEEWFEPAAGRVNWDGLGLRSRLWVSAVRKMPCTAFSSMGRRTKSENL